MSEEHKDFLARWSERKRAVRAEEEAVLQSEAPEPTEEAELEEAEANRRAAEAVDLDSLDYGSDFSVFFKTGVPKALQAEARRRLWRSSPVLANVDGLNDYDEDFSSPNLILKAFKSTYEIGKGYFERATAEAAPVPPVEEQQEETAVVSGEENTEAESVAVNEPDSAAEETAAVEEDAARPPALDGGAPPAEPPKVSLRDRLGLRGEGEV